MELFAGLSVAVLVLVAAAVAIKTFALWLRTRGMPELPLTLYLTCATVVGYPLAIAMGLIPAAESRLLHVLAELVMAGGWASLLLFTLNVFRRDSPWAKALAGFCLLLVAAGVAAYVREVMSPHPRTPQELPVFTVALSTPVAIAYFWTTFEALAYYGKLKRRLALGLADNAVSNRVLLWGLMTLSAGSALVINMAGMLAGVYMTAVMISISSVLGIAQTVCLFLAFHPPAWYRGWLERGPAAEGA